MNISKTTLLSQATAANTALILVILGWLLVLHGIRSQIGDPDPRNRHILNIELGIGFVLLIKAVWLSGYSFTHAKLRASIALLALLIPAFIILIDEFVSFGGGP